MIDETLIRHNFYNMLKKSDEQDLLQWTITLTNAYIRTTPLCRLIDDEHILFETNFSQVLFASRRLFVYV